MHTQLHPTSSGQAEMSLEQNALSHCSAYGSSLEPPQGAALPPDIARTTGHGMRFRSASRACHLGLSPSRHSRHSRPAQGDSPLLNRNGAHSPPPRPPEAP
jgi:hypothetical protein